MFKLEELKKRHSEVSVRPSSAQSDLVRTHFHWVSMLIPAHDSAHQWIATGDQRCGTRPTDVGW